jgi:putative MATE family efflux protein
VRNTKDLTEGNIYKNFFLFAIPLVLSQLLSLSYNIFDSMIAGKFINNFAVGAVGATYSFDLLLLTMFLGFAVGFSIYISRKFGEKNFLKIRNDIINMLIFMGSLIIIVGFVCVLLSEPIIDLFNVDDEIRKDATTYFVIHKMGLLFIIINGVFVHIMNSLGASGYSFLMSALSAVLNVTGNLLFVIGFNMKIEGLALATVLSAAVVSIFFVIKLVVIFKEFNLEKGSFKISFACIPDTIKYSLPTCLQQIVMYTSGLIITPTINALGPTATTGYTVAYKIFNVPSEVYFSASRTVGVYTAQSIGAKKYDGIQKGLFVGLFQSLILSLPFLLVCCVFTGQVASIFFEDGYTGEAFNFAVMFGSYYLPFVVVNVINNICHNFFRGLKKMGLLIISTAVGSASKLLFTFMLVPFMQLQGVFLGWTLSWFAEAIFCIIVYLVLFRTKEKVIKVAMNS